MNKITLNPKGSNDVLFRILIIAAVVILFAVVLYIMFGPLPNQKNFVTKDGNNSGVLNQLQVNGTSLLKGNVTTDANLEVNGDGVVDGTLTAHSTNFITTSGSVNTIQGKIVPSGNGVLDLQAGVFVNVKDLNGNKTADFNTSNKQSTFYGNVSVNGTAGLTVLNDTTTNNTYKVTNDPTSNNLLIKSVNSAGTVSKTILDAEETGNRIDLLSSSIAPLLYVGVGGGRVYDTVYNIPPTADLSPTLDSLIVTGATTLNGTNTLNGATTLNSTLTAKEDVTLDSADLIMNKSAYNIRFTDSTSGAANWISFAGTGVSGNQRLLGFANGDMFLQTNTKVGIQNGVNANLGGNATFDTRSNLVRNPYLEPFVNIANGYMKVTLPQYGINPFTYGGVPAGVQVNSYTYTLGAFSNSSPSYGPWKLNTVISPWNSTQPGANGRLVDVPGLFASTPLAGWQCPKKGIWSISYNSYYVSTTISPYTATPFTVIGNRNTDEVYGNDNVTTFAVIDFNQVIAAYVKSGSSGNFPGFSGLPPTLTFNLIMELNN